MGIRNWVSSNIMHVEGEDTANYSLFGHKRIDDINQTHVLSEQVGKLEKLDDSQRQAFQNKLLDNRLNAYMDTLMTPSFNQKKTYRQTIGPFDVPYMKAPVPRFLDMHIADSKRSYNEHTAGSRVEEAFLEADQEVQTQFLARLATQMDNAGAISIYRGLRKLYNAISHPENKKMTTKVLDAIVNPTSLRQRDNLATLQDKQAHLTDEIATPRNERTLRRHRIKGAGDLLLRREQRKNSDSIIARENPSSYDRYLADGDGQKAADRPLYVNQHINQIRDNQSRVNAPLSEAFSSSASRQATVKTEFDGLGTAIRTYRNIISSETVSDADREEARQALMSSVLPILKSAEGKAVRRTVRDMISQLKKAGVAPELLAPLYEIMPDEAGQALKIVQSLSKGLGKGLRKTDSAERTAQALQMVLDLIAGNALENELKTNLMYFNTEHADLMVSMLNDPTGLDPAQRLQLWNFAKTKPGRELRKAAIGYAESKWPADNASLATMKDRKTDIDDFLSAFKAGVLQHAAPELPQDGTGTPAAIMHDLITENQHLFMHTTDEDFWNKEGLDKIWTPLTAAEGKATKTRIYKQMTLRAAMMGMDTTEVNGFMAQGIENRLRTRNMLVEGSKVGGLAGAAFGNIMAKVLTVPMAQWQAWTAIPGIADILLMPPGWAAGLLPGALLAGAPLSHQKNRRLRETAKVRHDSEQNTVAVQNRIDIPGRYQSRGMSQALIRTKNPDAAMAHSETVQFARAHGEVWRDITVETFVTLYKSSRALLIQGPIAAWDDLIVHGGKLKFGSKTNIPALAQENSAL